MPETPRLSNDKLVSNSDDEELNAKRNQNEQYEQQTSEYICHLKNLCTENSAEQPDIVIPRLLTLESTPKLSSTPLSTFNILLPTSQQLLL